MNELDDGQRAFSSFRVLNGDDNHSEREQLFRNMAQLFSYVSDRCDDEQVAQYDEVLCHLAELVEVEARVHVAKLLAPLERAPGMVVVKLANDAIEVAKPLLEFSNVLSDDDLIDIIAKPERGASHRHRRPHHRARPGRRGDRRAWRQTVGGAAGAQCQCRNRARRRWKSWWSAPPSDADIAADLRGRAEIDWKSLRGEINSVAGKVLETLGEVHHRLDPVATDKVNAVVYNRIRNRAGFSASEWKLAYNQVKALSDRRQLDDRALARFARFGYGHHAAAALTRDAQGQPGSVRQMAGRAGLCGGHRGAQGAGLTPELFERDRGDHAVARHAERAGPQAHPGPLRSASPRKKPRIFSNSGAPTPSAADGRRSRWLSIAGCRPPNPDRHSASPAGPARSWSFPERSAPADPTYEGMTPLTSWQSWTQAVKRLPTVAHWLRRSPCPSTTTI